MSSHRDREGSLKSKVEDSLEMSTPSFEGHLIYQGSSYKGTSGPSSYDGNCYGSGQYDGEAVGEDVDGVDENGDESQPLLNNTNGPACCPARYILCMTGFIGFVLVYCLRVTVSIAVAAMVNSSLTSSRDLNGSGQYCMDENSNSNDTETGDFNWNSHTQEMLLSGFFYGYIFTQIPGGWMADKFGGKYVFAIGVLCTSICALVYPVSAYISVTLLFATRVISGIGEGFTFPAMYAMFGNWIHPDERTRLAIFTFSGSCIGNVLGQAVSGAMANSTFLDGWPSPFYLFGTIGLIWFIAWLFLAYDTPAKHPRISVEERKYIETGLAVKAKIVPKIVPWHNILTSMPVWSIVIAHMTMCWGYFTLLTNLPIYMSDVLRFTLFETGIFSAVPYAVQWIFLTGTGLLSDYVIVRGTFSRTMVRKFCVTIGLVGYGVCLVLVGYVGCNRALSVVFMSLGLGICGMGFGGYLPNNLDIAPRYSGSIGGLVQTAGPISGILGPYVVGVLTEDQSDILGWQKVFWISFGINCFGAVFYLIFASGNEQPWATQDIEKEEISDNTSEKT